MFAVASNLLVARWICSVVARMSGVSLGYTKLATTQSETDSLRPVLVNFYGFVPALIIMSRVYNFIIPPTMVKVIQVTGRASSAGFRTGHTGHVPRGLHKKGPPQKYVILSVILCELRYNVGTPCKGFLEAVLLDFGVRAASRTGSNVLAQCAKTAH